VELNTCHEYIELNERKNVNPIIWYVLLYFSDRWLIFLFHVPFLKPMNELFSAIRIEQPVYFDDLRC